MAIQRYDIPVSGGDFEERYWSPIQVPVLDEDGNTMLLLHRAEDVTEFVREQQRGRRVHVQERLWRRRMQEAETDLFARAQELQALNAELRDTRDQLVLRALHDPLTGLLIRPVLLEQVSRALSRLARYPHPIAVLFVDLDGLKHVNDVYGHAAGDALIRCFADQLRSSVRPCDTVARFGGDEFVILLEDLNDDADAEAVAERVLQAARECPLPAELSAPPTASIGVAVTHRTDLSAETLVEHADQAMYRAKRSGGGRYEVFRGGTV
jgi:diguanylate cyclase (GGDEF)-like protein